MVGSIHVLNACFILSVCEIDIVTSVFQRGREINNLSEIQHLMCGKVRIQNQLHFKSHTQNDYQMQLLLVNTAPKPILRLS